MRSLSFFQEARRSISLRPSHSSTSISNQNHSQSQSNNSNNIDTIAIKMNTINTEWVRLPYIDSSYTYTTNTNTTTNTTPFEINGSSDITSPTNTNTTTNTTTTTNPTTTTNSNYIDDNKRVTFPAYSLQRYAQHLHNDPVYCVCYSLTMVAGSGSISSNSSSSSEKGSSKSTTSITNNTTTTNITNNTNNNNNANNNTTYRAEGCSTLPVGSEWLSRALACVSKLNSEVTRNFKDGCRLSKQQVCN